MKLSINSTNQAMATSCHRQVLALWANNQKSNAWVYLNPGGWRKLDDRNHDACTNLLAVATLAKERGVKVMVDEEFRNDRWHITEIYDFTHGSNPIAQEVNFSVSECIYGWTAAYQQTGTHILVRIRLNPDDDISASKLEELKERWKTGIEEKWSYRFACCRTPGCTERCAMTFEVQWVESNEHHTVRVQSGSGRSNMTLWDENDSGDVASHEYGHMLGHPDEYDSDTCPARNPVNTGNVMDDNSEVVERLVEPFCDRLSQDTVPS